MSEKLRAAGLSEHVVHQLTVMTELHKQGRYDRMSEDYLKLTGETPTRPSTRREDPRDGRRRSKSRSGDLSTIRGARTVAEAAASTL